MDITVDTTLEQKDVEWALDWIELARKEKNEKLLARFTAPPDNKFAPGVPRQFWIHLLKQRYFDKLTPAQLIDCLGSIDTVVYLITLANALHTPSKNKKRKTPASDVEQQPKYPPPRFDGGKCLWPGCGKEIKGGIGSRRNHWRTHTKEKPYPCRYNGCKQAFTQLCHRNNHEQTHTKDKPYPCQYDGCTKLFARPESRDKHERTHTGEKPYLCRRPGCDQAFNQETHRKIHERTHTGDKPYPCRHLGCDQTFTTWGARERHERTHSGEKPYPCRHPGCDQAFNDSGNRKTHERTHTGEKPYPCRYEGCDYASSQSGNRDNHEISQHTPEGQQRQKREENRMHKAFLYRGETPDYGGQGKNPNQLVDLSCVGGTRAYPDFVFQFPRMLVLRECDEHQHTDRMLSCEMKRMVDIVAALRVGGEKRPIVFMRINPHGYKVDGITKKMPYDTRIDNVVDLTKTFQPKLDFTIIYCNFSVCKFPGKEERLPEILMDKDFPEELKQCVMCLY